jgi:hypothetical protein
MPSGGHLGPDRAQLGHDFLMHGTDLAIDIRRHRDVAHNSFFDTKTSAMNRHEICP